MYYYSSLPNVSEPLKIQRVLREVFMRNVELLLFLFLRWVRNSLSARTAPTFNGKLESYIKMKNYFILAKINK